ncbi:pleckstrin homology domain-containing family F member 1-like [Branchiostoma floridae]|uniref:Pleckstrin homology domain-containing family F member 1-like n=1 Tax=Branchiostoma floridae TaxID=7739 RepID=A0A9J7K9Q0_BRAFL|nr:pleckstrin homology domain-containing family F member 1-like [Branchiostoma floridae]
MGLCHASSTTGVSAAKLPGGNTAPQQPGAGPGTEGQAGQYDWQPDDEANLCQRCLQTRFTLLERRHHCRNCGRVVCGDCSKRKEILHHKPVRVCNVCAENLQNIRLPADTDGGDGSDSEEEEEDERTRMRMCALE